MYAKSLQNHSGEKYRLAQTKARIILYLPPGNACEQSLLCINKPYRHFDLPWLVLTLSDVVEEADAGPDRVESFPAAS
jgi:hypothetical protein